MSSEVWVALAGAGTAFLTGVLTAVGKSRALKSDQIISTLKEVRAWSDDLQESEKACRAELHDLRVELEVLRREVDRLRSIIGGEA